MKRKQNRNRPRKNQEKRENDERKPNQNRQSKKTETETNQRNAKKIETNNEKKRQKQGTSDGTQIKSTARRILFGLRFFQARPKKNICDFGRKRFVQGELFFWEIDFFSK